MSTNCSIPPVRGSTKLETMSARGRRDASAAVASMLRARRPPDAGAALTSAPEPDRQEDDVRDCERDGDLEQASPVLLKRRLEGRRTDRRSDRGAGSRR